MFEIVTPGISGHSEPTAAAIAKRFSALARRVISMLHSNLGATGVKPTSITKPNYAPSHVVLLNRDVHAERGAKRRVPFRHRRPSPKGSCGHALRGERQRREQIGTLESPSCRRTCHQDGFLMARR